MSTLIVALAPPGSVNTTDYPYVLTADGHVLTSQASAPVALLPHTGRSGDELIAIVPVQALSWHRVTLPKGTGANSPRLRAVLEGLLEERLLDEPATLHFALEPNPQPGQPVWVAACDRQWLSSAIQALESAGRPVSRIVPELAPADGQDTPTARYAIEARDGSAQWVTIDHDRGVSVLPMAATTLAWLQAPANGEAAPVLAEPAVATQAESLLGHPVTLQTSAQRWLVSARNPWDLAQFELASSGRARAFKKARAMGNSLLHAPQWRALRWGAIALVLANLVGLNAWAWREKSNLQAQQLAMRNVLLQTFPSIQVVVDAPLQMERELALLRQSTGGISGSDLEAILGALSQVLPHGKTAQAIEFSAGEARIRGLSLGADESTDITARLQALGYGARLDGDTLVLRMETLK